MTTQSQANIDRHLRALAREVKNARDCNKRGGDLAACIRQAASLLQSIRLEMPAEAPRFAPSAQPIQIGDRVQTLQPKFEAMIGINIPSGVSGTISKLQPCNEMLILGIKLDQHFDDLAEWENELQFYLEAGEQPADYVSRI